MAKVLCCFSLSLNAKRTEEVRKIEKKWNGGGSGGEGKTSEGRNFKKREKNMEIACVLTACVHDWTQRWQQS